MSVNFSVTFEILELKFTFVNEHFKMSKVTLKLAFVKNALICYFNKITVMFSDIKNSIIIKK